MTHQQEETAAAGLAEAAAAAVPPTPGLSEEEMGRVRVQAAEVTETLAERLAGWLRQQPEIGPDGVTDLGMGIYGIAATAPDGGEVSISMVFQPTQ